MTAETELQKIVDGLTPEEPPDISDDALKLGSQDWQNHVPIAIAVLWPQLDIEARLAVFICVWFFTNMDAPPLP